MEYIISNMEQQEKKTATILIVDDDPVIRGLIKSVFLNKDFNSTSYSSSDKSLSGASLKSSISASLSNKPSVILVFPISAVNNIKIILASLQGLF